ncbi:hypothetical protein GCM10023231_35150 [Olivibacter ginsenosidimutans]|uniref:Outer membrane protein beta-barrel domain-containing protein n=1 Tax=Olivibacter ginsenosidimutans TaxID=1176537 RepID=A0ABP9C0D8_9SPHI
MIKPFLIVLAVLCFSGLTYSQTISLGLKGGITIPHLPAPGAKNNVFNGGYRSRLEPDVSIFVDVRFSDWLSLQPTMEYAVQGGDKNGFQAIPFPEELIPELHGQTPPEYLYADIQSTATFNYLLFPVLVKLGLNLGSSPFRVYGGIGPFVGILLNARQKTSGHSTVYLDEDKQTLVPDPAHPKSPLVYTFDANIDSKDELNTTNVGLEGILGIAYKLNRSSIFIEGGGNYGFLDIQKEKTNGQNHTGAVVVSLGYAYTL